MKHQMLLVLLVLALCVAPSTVWAQSQATVTGQVLGATSGAVLFRLAPWSPAIHYFVPNVTAIATQTQVCGISGSGVVLNALLSGPCLLWGNDTISPANTTYTVVFQPNGTTTNTVALEQITGTTYNLNLPVFGASVKLVPQFQTFTTAPIGVNLVPAAPHAFSVGLSGAPYATGFFDQLFVGGVSINQPITPANLIITNSVTAPHLVGTTDVVTPLATVTNLVATGVVSNTLITTSETVGTVTAGTAIVGTLTAVNATLATANTTTFNNRQFCQTGADIGAKINAAVALLPSTGGVVDCTNLQGTQSTATSVPLAKAVVLLLGATNYTYTGAASTFAFTVTATGAYIQGLGQGVTTVTIANTGADGIGFGSVGVNIQDVGAANLYITGGRRSLSVNNVIGAHFERMRMNGATNGIYMMGQNENQMWQDTNITAMSGNALITGQTNGGVCTGGFNFPEMQKSIFDLLRLSGTVGNTAAAITAGSCNGQQTTLGNIFRRVRCEGNARTCMDFSFSTFTTVDTVTTEDTLDANNAYSAIQFDNTSSATIRNALLGTSGGNNYKYLIDVQDASVLVLNGMNAGAAQAAGTADIHVEGTIDVNGVFYSIGAASTGLLFANTNALNRSSTVGMYNSSGALVPGFGNWIVPGQLSWPTNEDQNAIKILLNDDTSNASWVSYGADTITRFKSNAPWEFTTEVAGVTRLGTGTMAARIRNDGSIQQTGTTFGSGLPAYPNGTMLYCSDCKSAFDAGTVGQVCASGGTGAMAMKMSTGAGWRCY